MCFLNNYFSLFKFSLMKRVAVNILFIASSVKIPSFELSLVLIFKPENFKQAFKLS